MQDFIMKGTVLDLLFIMIIGLAFSITAILGLYMLNMFSVESAGIITNTEGLGAITVGQNILANFDTLFIFMIFGLAFVAIIGAFYIKAHPVMMLVSIFVLVIIIVIAPQISNMFLEFSRDSLMETTVDTSFTRMTTIYNNWPIIILSMGAVIILVIYAKIRGGGPSGFA